MAITKEKLVISSLRRLMNGTALMSRRQAGRIGYYLLTKPRRLADDPGSQDFLHEAEQETLDLLGVDIRTYHWPGSGPSVLLLHGWESSSARWYKLFPKLREQDYNIYALDAPAHGRSGGKRFTVFQYCQILQAYFEHRGEAQDVWIGHSGGGMASIYYSSQKQFTYRPKELICMAVPGELVDFINKFCSVIGLNQKVKDGIEQSFIRKLRHKFADVNFKEFVKNLCVPGLIIHDEEDDVAPIDGARKMHDNWTGSALRTTKGYGHSLTGELVPTLIVSYLEASQNVVRLA